MSHTKGPWLVSRRHATTVIATHDLGTDMPICVMIAGDDVEANARLIASAPDLLSIVKRFVKGAIGEMSELEQTITEAIALIEKLEPKKKEDKP